MLRITVYRHVPAIRFQLEGSVSGPWVRVLEECWLNALPANSNVSVSVDLTGVTSIDSSGQACLAAMHRQGAEFIAADALTKAIVAEITELSVPGDQP